LVDCGADPLVRKNLVRDGKAGGIVVGSGGLGVFEGNRVFMNANVGFKVESGGAPLVKDNEFNNGNGCGLCLLEGAMGEFADNVIAGNYGDQLRVEGNRLGGDNKHLIFTNNTVDWKTQPSFRLPEFAPVIRAQGSKAFLEQKEDPEEATSLPGISGAGARSAATAPAMSRFRSAGSKVKVAAAIQLGAGKMPKKHGSLASTIATVTTKSVKWLTELDDD
jgi:hypothetical protein